MHYGPLRIPLFDVFNIDELCNTETLFKIAVIAATNGVGLSVG